MSGCLIHELDNLHGIYSPRSPQYIRLVFASLTLAVEVSEPFLISNRTVPEASTLLAVHFHHPDGLAAGQDKTAWHHQFQ